jgi:hypothetical protein
MAKSLDEGFDTFLSWLVPLKSENKKAQDHKDSVQSCLESNFGCYRFFETGSFGHGTGVRHYSDTDYFAVCPSSQIYGNSGYSLRMVKEALQKKFWNTDAIEVRRPAVQIPFGTYKSENLEVTPCTYNGMVDTPVGNMPYYDIAGQNDTWMQSSPQAHIKYVKQEDERLGGKLKPLIQLIKSWKYYNSAPINSFYLELRVTKYAEKETSIVYDIDMRYIIKLLFENGLASIQDPMGISGYVPACNTDAKKTEALSKLSTAYSRAEKAYSERDKNLDNCFDWWDKFFNGRFPSR